jgi:hypothetical protein
MGTYSVLLHTDTKATTAFLDIIAETRKAQPRIIDQGKSKSSGWVHVFA